MHATPLLQAGVPPKVVSERLGHATVSFTMQVYAHVIQGMQADAAAALADLTTTLTLIPTTRPTSERTVCATVTRHAVWRRA